MDISGGALIAQNSQTLIVYGQRLDVVEKDFYVYSVDPLRELNSTKLLLRSFSGEVFGFAVYNNQPFESSDGSTVLGDFYVAFPMVDWDQKVTLSVIRLGGIGIDILKQFSFEGLPASGFAPPRGDIITIEGWLELYAISEIDERLGNRNPPAMMMVLLHKRDQQYALGFLPGFETDVPQEDMKTGDFLSISTGENTAYRVTGILDGQVGLIQQGQIPILQTIHLKRLPVDVLLTETFEDGSLDPRISVTTVGSFRSHPGIKDVTNFGNTKAFGFGMSSCKADCFQGYVTSLNITFPSPTYVSTLSFKEMELYGNWGAGGKIYVDGISLTPEGYPPPFIVGFSANVMDFGRNPFNDLQADVTYRKHVFPINREVNLIEFKVGDITNLSEIFIDDLVINTVP